MQPPDAIVRHARQLVETFCASPQAPADLATVAESLRRFARSSVWHAAPFREAAKGEELLYELAVSPGSGPSLYLVSDGVGVVGPPHCHETWVVIAGIRGRELNHRYAVHSLEARTVVHDTEVEVGPGQALVLAAADIHSTEVRGARPTFHLHLYGRPLRDLPSFDSRRFAVAADG
jgi:predicted metal-dependent enzyme (double-stranded beta helix superfamily)